MFEIRMNFSIHDAFGRGVVTNVSPRIRPEGFVAETFVSKNVHRSGERCSFIYVWSIHRVVIEIGSRYQFCVLVLESFKEISNRSDRVCCTRIRLSLIEHGWKSFPKIHRVGVQNRVREDQIIRQYSFEQHNYLMW